MAVDRRFVVDQDFGRRLYVDDEQYENQMGVGSRKPAFTQNDEIYAQSQFKKPYLEDDYEEMEYYSDSFPGFPYDYNYDTPFVTGINNLTGEGSNPWHVVCYCDLLNACYGRGGYQCQDAGCGWPIIGLVVDSAPANCDVILQGQQVCGKCDNLQETGTINYHINMRAKFKHNGKTVTVTCSHYSSMSHCFVGCVSESMRWDYDNSDDEIGQSDSAIVYVVDRDYKVGTSTYSWSVSGTGFYLDSGHTVTTLVTSAPATTIYTDATACGTGIVTVTGCDGTQATGGVRCTAASEWVVKADACPSAGEATSNTGSTYYRTRDNWRVTMDFAFCPQCSFGINACDDCEYLGDQCYNTCEDENPSEWCRFNMCIRFRCEDTVSDWVNKYNCCGDSTAAGAQCHKCSFYDYHEWECS